MEPTQRPKTTLAIPPLHWAAKNGHIESAKLLIVHGAEIEAVNANGDLPLDLAHRWGQDAFVNAFFIHADCEDQAIRTPCRHSMTYRLKPVDCFTA